MIDYEVPLAGLGYLRQVRDSGGPVWGALWGMNPGESTHGR